jgi:aryl carrier-like protein
MYRTGDIARVLPSGDICILGRNDQQIKLRGFRIELGEIEAALENCGEVRGAAVVVREHVPGNPELVAYFVNRPGFHQTAASLRTALAAEVPAYMVPTVWMELDALPLSPAGKIDRSALPAPVASAPVTDAVAEALTPTEAALARIWAEVLHLDCVQASANLFSLGVDSLQIFAITARANAAGVRFAAKELFRSPTLADLARVIDEREPVSA